MTIWLSLAVCIGGALVYLLSATRWQTLGIVAYGCGLLVFLQTVGPKLLSLFGGH